MLKQSYNQPGKYIYSVLVSRLLLFLLFQIFIALLTGSWAESEKYWLLSATFTNIVSITLLFFLFRREGQNYLGIFRISRSGFRKDILVFSGIALISGPLVFAPGYFLSLLLWNDPEIPADSCLVLLKPGWYMYY